MYIEIHPLAHYSANNQHLYELIWIKTGSGNTVYCLGPGHQQSFSGLNGYCITLSFEFIYMVEMETNPVFSGTDPLMISIDEENEYAEEILLKMMKEQSSLHGELLKALFRIFMLYLSRNITTQTNDLVRQFTILLRSNFLTRKTVADYAAELCVTPQYLNRVVKKSSGLTASQHIQKVIILEAKKRVLNSNSSMKEIAYHLGFSDTSHFSKFFKNYTGVSFSTFKNTIIL